MAVKSFRRKQAFPIGVSGRNFLFLVGAFGNVGAVLFLTVLSFVSPVVFFTVIAAGALFVLVAVQFIEEPEGHMVEVQDDGTVEMIELS